MGGGGVTVYTPALWRPLEVGPLDDRGLARRSPTTGRCKSAFPPLKYVWDDASLSALTSQAIHLCKRYETCIRPHRRCAHARTLCGLPQDA